MECEKKKEHEMALKRIQEGGLSDKEVNRVCKIFYLLSDAGRFRIVEALLKGALCVFHLTEICQSTTSAVSHQLRVLKDNGIVTAKKIGKFVEYSIADEHIKKIVEMGIIHLKCAWEDSGRE